MEAHDTPALRNSSSENFVRMSSLEPPPKPPPWMKMTSGVGLSDLAFHRSMTLNFLSLPYTTLVISAGVVEAGFFGGPLGSDEPGRPGTPLVPGGRVLLVPGGSAESRMPDKSIIGS